MLHRSELKRDCQTIILKRISKQFGKTKSCESKTRKEGGRKNIRHTWNHQHQRAPIIFIKNDEISEEESRQKLENKPSFLGKNKIKKPLKAVCLKEKQTICTSESISQNKFDRLVTHVEAN